MACSNTHQQIDQAAICYWAADVLEGFTGSRPGLCMANFVQHSKPIVKNQIIIYSHVIRSSIRMCYFDLGLLIGF